MVNPRKYENSITCEKLLGSNFNRSAVCIINFRTFRITVFLNIGIVCIGRILYDNSCRSRLYAAHKSKSNTQHENNG